MAKAGSWRIGLNPKPLSVRKFIFSNGLDVRKVNNKNPNIKKP